MDIEKAIQEVDFIKKVLKKTKTVQILLERYAYSEIGGTFILI